MCVCRGNFWCKRPFSLLFPPFLLVRGLLGVDWRCSHPLCCPCAPLRCWFSCTRHRTAPCELPPSLMGKVYKPLAICTPLLVVTGGALVTVRWPCPTHCSHLTKFIPEGVSQWQWCISTVILLMYNHSALSQHTVIFTSMGWGNIESVIHKLSEGFGLKRGSRWPSVRNRKARRPSLLKSKVRPLVCSVDDC